MDINITVKQTASIAFPMLVNTKMSYYSLFRKYISGIFPVKSMVMVINSFIGS
jgi:hypothetical protein